MFKLSKIIRYYSGPFASIPVVPKIVIQPNGFVLNTEKVMLDEIISVFYRHNYSHTDADFPFINGSAYEILTKDRTLLFYGEHDELAQLFDQHLEKETYFDISNFGILIRRWKQIGNTYKSTSLADQTCRFVERLAKKRISRKTFWILLIVIILFLLFFIVIWLVLL